MASAETQLFFEGGNKKVFSCVNYLQGNMKHRNPL